MHVGLLDAASSLETLASRLELLRNFWQRCVFLSLLQKIGQNLHYNAGGLNITTVHGYIAFAGAVV